MDEQDHADLGVLQGQLDGPSQFARRTQLRTAARKAFVKEDCGRRVARAVLRKAAPLPGDYCAGDLVCYQRADEGWSTACRIIGFDGGKGVRLLHGGVPVCAGLDRLRPATSAEALAMLFLNDARNYVGAHPEDQQSFVDLRRPAPAAAAQDDDDDAIIEERATPPGGADSRPDTPRTIGEPEGELPLSPERRAGQIKREGTVELQSTPMRRRLESPRAEVTSGPGESRGASATDSWLRPIDVPEPVPAEPRDDAEALVAFYRERYVGTSRPYRSKNTKNLRYEKCDDLTKAGLDAARKIEWD